MPLPSVTITGIPCAARRAEAVLAQQREPRVIFQKKGQPELALAPRLKVKAGRVVELVIGGKHALFARTHDSRKTEHNRGTLGAIDLRGPQQPAKSFAERRQQGRKSRVAIGGQTFAGNNRASAHHRAGSVGAAEIDCQSGQIRHGWPSRITMRLLNPVSRIRA